MASASKLEFVSKTLRSVLVSSKEGVAMSSLQGEYEALVGDKLPFKEFGHQTLEAFLRSIPTVVKLQRAPNGSVMCHAVVVNTLQHVASLVSRQKGKKTKRSSNKAKPGRSYARPTFVPRPKPVYSHSNSSKPHPVRPRFHIHAGRPSPQTYRPAPSQGRFPPQSFTKPAQRPHKAINNAGDAKRNPSQQYKPLQSTYGRQPTAPAAAASKVAAATPMALPAAAASKVAAATPTASSAAAPSGLSDSSSSQQPTPGPWSGKLGSKRNQQPTASSTAVSSQPTKPVYENIYITVDNEYSKSKATSKVSPSKSTVKPEWSSNFEVPPRFKKKMSPKETTVQVDVNPSKQKSKQPSPREQQPSPQQRQQQELQEQQQQQQPQQQQSPQQVNSATSGWIIKTLEEKPNGIWASALSTMHEKEFGVAMETSIIQQMADLSLIKKESIYNNDILYPQVNVDVKSTPATESQPKTKPDTTLRHAAPAYPTHMHEPEAPSEAYVDMADILESVCQRQNLPVSYRTDHVTLVDRSYVSVRCNAGLGVGTGSGATKRAAKQAASANILHQWEVAPEELRPGLGGHEELCLRVEHQAGFCSCMPWNRANNSDKVLSCMSRSSQGLSWNPSSGWVRQDADRSTLMATETQGSSAMVESQQVEMRAAQVGSNLKMTPEMEVSQKGAYLLKSAVPKARRERFCVLNPHALSFPQEAEIMSKNTPEIGAYDISSPAEVVVAGHETKPVVPKGIQGDQSGISIIPDTIPNTDNQATLSGMTGRKDNPLKPTWDYRKEVAGASQRPTDQAARASRRGPNQEIRHALRETFGRTAIYETVKQTATEDGLVVTVCFIAGSIIGVGTGPTKAEARREALKVLLLKKHQQNLKKAKAHVSILDAESTVTPPAAHVRDPWMKTSCKTCLPRNGTSTDSSSFERQNGAVSSSTQYPTSSDVTVTTVTPSDRSSTNSSPCNPPLEDQVARSGPSPDFQAAEDSSNDQWARGQSPSSVGGEEAPVEPSEGRGSPTMEAPGVPRIQLPEEDEWDVYVAYITSLSDFYVILIGDDYSEQLIILEEEMRTFYQCCTWTVTEPPEEGDCYAAEFNREWLRVEVKAVEGDKVQCFLLDHGDLETTDVSSLRPLADPFIQLPFQLIHCKLSGSEQAADDDKVALQMFCQLALGKSLLAEVTSRQGDRVEMDLFDNSDISILEQCMAAGI